MSRPPRLPSLASTKSALLTAGRFLRRHWICTLATLIHYTLTAIAGLTLIQGAWERFDDIEGHGIYQISDHTLELTTTAAHALAFPLGYASYFNGSWLIGLLLMNSPLVCFSPVWVPAVIRRIRKRSLG